MSSYSPARHILNEPQTNLSLPNAPMPYNKKNFRRRSLSLLLAVKCSFSFARTLVRPVNRMLEFGFTGIAASDVALLPALV